MQPATVEEPVEVAVPLPATVEEPQQPEAVAVPLPATVPVPASVPAGDGSSTTGTPAVAWMLVALGSAGLAAATTRLRIRRRTR